LSPLLKPIFAANHHWAMRMGETSLKLELARRRAPTLEERGRIPPPPAPTGASTFLLTLGGVALLALAIRRLWR
jgi:hypothetical protein